MRNSLKQFKSRSRRLASGTFLIRLQKGFRNYDQCLVCRHDLERLRCCRGD